MEQVKALTAEQQQHRQQQQCARTPLNDYVVTALLRQLLLSIPSRKAARIVATFIFYASGIILSLLCTLINVVFILVWSPAIIFMARDRHKYILEVGTVWAMSHLCWVLIVINSSIWRVHIISPESNAEQQTLPPLACKDTDLNKCSDERINRTDSSDCSSRGDNSRKRSPLLHDVVKRWGSNSQDHDTLADTAFSDSSSSSTGDVTASTAPSTPSELNSPASCASAALKKEEVEEEESPLPPAAGPSKTSFDAVLTSHTNDKVQSTLILDSEKRKSSVTISYKPGRTIVMSNHLSNADGFFLRGVCSPWPMKAIYKADLLWVPALGGVLASSRDVSIAFTSERGGWGTTKSGVVSMMRRIKSLIDLSIPILVFPEGARRRFNRMSPFRSGLFKFALEHSVDIYPLVVYGTQNGWPAGSYLVDFADIYIVQSSTPLQPQGHTLESLKSAVLEKMVDMLKLCPGYDPVTERPIESMAEFEKLTLASNSKLKLF